jgi:hypothetical protein
MKILSYFSLELPSRVAEDGPMTGPRGHRPLARALAQLFYGNPVHINGRKRLENRLVVNWISV